MISNYAKSIYMPMEDIIYASDNHVLCLLSGIMIYNIDNQFLNPCVLKGKNIRYFLILDSLKIAE